MSRAARFCLHGALDTWGSRDASPRGISGHGRCAGRSRGRRASSSLARLGRLAVACGRHALALWRYSLAFRHLRHGCLVLSAHVSLRGCASEAAFAWWVRRGWVAKSRSGRAVRRSSVYRMWSRWGVVRSSEWGERAGARRAWASAEHWCTADSVSESTAREFDICVNRGHAKGTRSGTPTARR